VSQLANTFVKDAREVVKTGDIVKVRVVEVDLARQRIALTMKLDVPTAAAGERRGEQAFRPAARGERAPARNGPAPAIGSMAAAFERLRGK
jgi:uncharacterized protein